MLKIEKPEKVVWAGLKSHSALFLETLGKKKFFEPPCRGGFEFPKIARVLHSLLLAGTLILTPVRKSLPYPPEFFYRKDEGILKLWSSARKLGHTYFLKV